MGIIRRIFSFWLIVGILAALAISYFLPRLKEKAIEKIPGREQAEKLIDQAKAAMKKLPEISESQDKDIVQKQANNQIEETKEVEQTEKPILEDSIEQRDEKLFQRQCSILDDLL